VGTPGIPTAEVNADFIKNADVQAVRDELAARITAATAIETNYDTMFLNGRARRCWSSDRTIL